MREVFKDQFYKTMGPQNVHPHIVSDRYPYSTEWRTPAGQVVGRVEPEAGGGHRYFVAEEVSRG